MKPGNALATIQSGVLIVRVRRYINQARKINSRQTSAVAIRALCIVALVSLSACAGGSFDGLFGADKKPAAAPVIDKDKAAAEEAAANPLTV